MVALHPHVPAFMSQTGAPRCSCAPLTRLGSMKPKLGMTPPLFDLQDEHRAIAHGPRRSVGACACHAIALDAENVTLDFFCSQLQRNVADERRGPRPPSQYSCTSVVRLPVHLTARRVLLACLIVQKHSIHSRFCRSDNAEGATILQDVIIKAWGDQEVGRPSAAQVRLEVQRAAQAMLLNLEDMTLRQEMLKRYDASCAVSGSRVAQQQPPTRPPNAHDGTLAGPGLSAAAERFMLSHPNVIAQAYDERTSVHLFPPTGTSLGPGARFVWGGGAATCGRRGHDCMEDTHFCYHELDILGNGTRVFMFGVFDGHGGPGAATHCSHVLPFEVAAAMRESENVAHALMTAFERCEASWSSWANPSADDSGCTAQVRFRVVVLCPLSLLNSFVTAFVTHCGDGR
jgi:hypothetical protein